MVEVRRKDWFQDGEFKMPRKPDINWKWFIWLIPIILIIWLATGIYIVQPDEQAVVRRFGKAVKTTGPGPHYHLPVPIEVVDKVKVKKVRRIEIGFRTIDPGPPAKYRFVPEESHMLTGDEQIVDAQATVQYEVSDPAKFLYNVRGLEDKSGTIKDAAEVALRKVVGQRGIDDVLISKKLEIEVEIRTLLQQIVDGYDSGVRIEETKLQTVRPPDQVSSAFSEVVSAKEDRERLIQEAKGYQEDVLPKARGQAEKLIREAEAYKSERTKRAQGDADNFSAVLAQYTTAKEITRKRLFLETMEKTLPGIKKIIIDKDTGENLLKFLPIDKGAAK